MIPLKWIKRHEDYLRHRQSWFAELMAAGRTWEGRRSFLKLTGMAAGVAAAKAFTPQSFQLVDVVDAAEPQRAGEKPFTFAYISDSHLYERH